DAARARPPRRGHRARPWRRVHGERRLRRRGAVRGAGPRVTRRGGRARLPAAAPQGAVLVGVERSFGHGAARRPPGGARGVARPPRPRRAAGPGAGRLRQGGDVSARGPAPDPDPYRDAVYRAEHEALPDGGRRFRRFAELEAWVEGVVLGPMWEARFPEAPLEVAVLRRSRGATFSAAHVTPDGDAAAVWIRDGSWDAVTVVHELAHVAAGRAHDPTGPHGAR